MVAVLAPNSILKNSGIKWVRMIGHDFDVKPLFTILEENKQKNDLKEDYNVLSLSYGRLIVKDKDDNKGLLSASNDSYQKIEPGYIVLRLTDLQNDQRSLRVGLAFEQGIITSAYVGLRPKNSDLNTKYLYYLLHSYDLMKVFYGYGGGIRQGMSYDDLKKLPLILPPRSSQLKVVSFLDGKLEKIDRFIANKRQTISGLAERKQVVISNAVTRGIDSKTLTKPSNIDQLSYMPTNWKTYPIKRLSSINTTALSEKTDPDKEFLYVDISSVNSDGDIVKKEPFLFKDAPSRARRVVKDGDTAISTVRTYLRAIGYIKLPEDNLIVSTGFAVCTPNPKIIDKEFLQYAVRSNYFIEKVVSDSYGVSYPAITPEKLGCHKIILPDTIKEQRRIVSFIKSEVAVIDRAINKSRSQIKLIKEYRDSLITQAVTGQIEIKE